MAELSKFRSLRDFETSSIFTRIRYRHDSGKFKPTWAPSVCLKHSCRQQWRDSHLTTSSILTIFGNFQYRSWPPPKMLYCLESLKFKNNGIFCKISKTETFFLYVMSQIFYLLDVSNIRNFCSHQILKSFTIHNFEARFSSTSLTSKLVFFVRKLPK